MNKLIECFIKNCVADDVLQATYGISNHEKFDCVFVAPVWAPEKIFDLQKIDIEPIYADACSMSYRIRQNGKKYLFVQLHIGAPNMIDFCLSCYQMNCDNFVLVGSAGSLVLDIDMGDVIVPSCVISGNGATAYLCENLGEKKLFDKAYSSETLNDKIRKVALKNGMKTLDVPVVSVDSVVAEYIHADEFREMGAQVIEMEVATFFQSMEYIGKKASALLVISDNSSAGKHLIGRAEDEKAHYYQMRSKLRDVLLEL